MKSVKIIACLGFIAWTTGITGCSSSEPNFCAQFSDMLCARVRDCYAIPTTQDQVNKCSNEMKTKLVYLEYSNDDCAEAVGELSHMSCSDVYSIVGHVAPGSPVPLSSVVKGIDGIDLLFRGVYK